MLDLLIFTECTVNTGLGWGREQPKQGSDGTQGKEGERKRQSTGDSKGR
jgi:hypothetical protein